jgi:hypothetical protein
MVLSDDIKWISFHSYYDFGYLIKILTCKPLPAEENDFFEWLRIYFPVPHHAAPSITPVGYSDWSDRI